MQGKENSQTEGHDRMTIFPVMKATKFGEDATPEYPCVPEEFSPEGGLTKRELFAAMILQGMWSNAHALASVSASAKSAGMTAIQHLAESSVEQANALIKELAK